MSARRGGFVLMAALWLLVALSAVGLDAALRHRKHRIAAANLLDQTRMRAAADAGAEYARSRLTSAMLGRVDELRAEAARQNTGRSGRAAGRGNSMREIFQGRDPGLDPWRDPSQLVPPQLEWNGVVTTLAVRDPGAALNINSADATMWSQFFSLGLGIDYALANKLAAAILDWRDADDIPTSNGGERTEYLKDGAPVLPGNREFANIDELRFVLGMNDEIFGAARPYLRSASGGRINVNAAPEAVLLALPGMNREGATAILRQRRAGIYARSLNELMAMLPGSTVNSIMAQSISDQGGRGGGGRGGGPGGQNSLQSGPFARRVTFSTDQVEILANASVPGNPVEVTSQVIVDRAINGATVSWRRVQ